MLLDLDLPDSVGLETLKSIREFATGIPIVVMTELTNEQEAIDAVHLGAQDCFEKSEAITKPLGQLLQYSIERYHRQTAEREIAYGGVCAAAAVSEFPASDAQTGYGWSV